MEPESQSERHKWQKKGDDGGGGGGGGDFRVDAGKMAECCGGAQVRNTKMIGKRDFSESVE